MRYVWKEPSTQQVLKKYEFPSPSLFIYLPANLLAKTSETQTRWLLSGNREELSAPPHLPSRPQICRLSLQQELQPRAQWWSICFANVIISQHWFLMGRDQYPELLCSQTLQKKTPPYFLEQKCNQNERSSSTILSHAPEKTGKHPATAGLDPSRGPHPSACRSL